jgi:hypothetical protein
VNEQHELGIFNFFTHLKQLQRRKFMDLPWLFSLKARNYSEFQDMTAFPGFKDYATKSYPLIFNSKDFKQKTDSSKTKMYNYYTISLHMNDMIEGIISGLGVSRRCFHTWVYNKNLKMQIFKPFWKDNEPSSHRFATSNFLQDSV